ncbi:hypothetical protein RI367_000373 [Sorochytrium milnesiophthora]
MSLTDRAFAVLAQLPPRADVPDAFSQPSLYSLATLPPVPLDPRAPTPRSHFEIRLGAADHHQKIDVDVQVLGEVLESLRGVGQVIPNPAQKVTRSRATSNPPPAIRQLSQETMRCDGTEFLMDNFEEVEASEGGSSGTGGTTQSKTSTTKKWDLLRSSKGAGKADKKASKFNFVPKAIKEPLTRGISTSGSQPLVKAAVEQFAHVMMFMGDKDINLKSSASAPSSGGSGTATDAAGQRCECAKLVVMAGMEHGTAMCDEIFCQIMKQINFNKSMESTKRGWTLLALCCSFLRPSTLTEPFLRKFIYDSWKHNSNYYNIGARSSTTSVDGRPRRPSVDSVAPDPGRLDDLRLLMKWSYDRACDCDERLNKCLSLPPRNMGPTDEEILTIESMTPCHIKIYSPDSNAKTMSVNSFTLAKELTAKFLERYEIVDGKAEDGSNIADEYGLIVLMNMKYPTLPVLPDDRIMDIVSLSDSIAIQAGLMADWKQRSSAYCLAFERKLWLSPMRELSLPSFEFLFSQLRRDFLSGNLLSHKEINPAKRDAMFRIVALLLAANPLNQGESVLKYVPPILNEHASKAELEVGVQTAYRHIGETVASAQDAKQEFVSSVSQWDLYGNNVFDFKAPNDARFADGGMLCVSAKEILVLNARTRSVLMAIGYDELSDFVIEEGDVIIRTDSLLKKRLIRCQTTQGFVVVDVLATYLESTVDDSFKMRSLTMVSLTLALLLVAIVRAAPMVNAPPGTPTAIKLKAIVPRDTDFVPRTTSSTVFAGRASNGREGVASPKVKATVQIEAKRPFVDLTGIAAVQGVSCSKDGSAVSVAFADRGTAKRAFEAWSNVNDDFFLLIDGKHDCGNAQEAAMRAVHKVKVSGTRLSLTTKPVALNDGIERLDIDLAQQASLPKPAPRQPQGASNAAVGKRATDRAWDYSFGANYDPSTQTAANSNVTVFNTQDVGFDCIDCYSHGDVALRLKINTRLGVVTNYELSLEGDVGTNIDAALRLHPRAVAHTMDATLFSVGLLPVSIPGVFELGPEFRVLAGVSFFNNAEVVVTTGFDAQIGFDWRMSSNGLFSKPTFSSTGGQPSFSVHPVATKTLGSVSTALRFSPAFVLALKVLTIADFSMSLKLDNSMGVEMDAGGPDMRCSDSEFDVKVFRQHQLAFDIKMVGKKTAQHVLWDTGKSVLSCAFCDLCLKVDV